MSIGMSSPIKTGQKLAGYDVNQLQRYTPEQMNLFKSMFSNVSPDSYTSRLAGGDRSAFEQMEAPAMRQFNELQGNIASRFSGMGSGARRSSGFQNQMSAAGSNFAQDLQSRRQELQRQALQDLMGMSTTLLGQQPYETYLTPPKQSFLSQLMSGGANMVGGALGGLSAGGGNPLGGIAGGLSGLFGGNRQQAPQRQSYASASPFQLPSFGQMQ